MSLRPHSVLFLISLLFITLSRAEWDFEPETLDVSLMDNLIKKSPFQRLVSVKDTYNLQAVARIEGRTYVTLHHKKTGKRIIVDDQTDNEIGMRLVSVSGGAAPKDVKVMINFFGEEAEFAYQESQLIGRARFQQKTHTVRRDKTGRPVTTEELVKKYFTLTKEQRANYMRWKNAQVKAHPNLEYSEKRFPIAHKALDAFKNGRKPPPFK